MITCSLLMDCYHPTLLTQKVTHPTPLTSGELLAFPQVVSYLCTDLMRYRYIEEYAEKANASHFYQ